MVGKIMSRPEKRKTPGKKMMTTTYKKGGTVKKAKGGKVTKKNMGGMMPGNQKDVIASGLPTMDAYVKAVGEHKAYTIMEQEIQDLQKDEENDDREGTAKA